MKEKFLSKNHFLVLKANAIIAILISHVGNFSNKTWFTPLGGFGVAIFLFCSGYGLSISAKNGGVQNYWLKKIVNVYFPFLVTEVIASIVFQRNLTGVLFDILLIKGGHPYIWYMKYIFGCYLIFYILFKFVKNSNLFVAIFFCLGIASFFIFPNLQGEQAFSFPLGIATANHLNIKSPDKKRLFLLGSVFCLIGVFFLAVKQLPSVSETHHYLITLLNLVLKISAALGIVFISYSLLKYTHFLKPIGKISYELYLIHGYIIFFVSKNVFGNFFINTLVFLTITFIISLILNYILTKIKKLGVFKKIVK